MVRVLDLADVQRSFCFITSRRQQVQRYKDFITVHCKTCLICFRNATSCILVQVLSKMLMEVMNSVGGVVREVISSAVTIVITLFVRRVSVEISGAKSCQTFLILVSHKLDEICIYSTYPCHFNSTCLLELTPGILEGAALWIRCITCIIACWVAEFSYSSDT
jgi:hypothetical protein